ncbi:flavodoxin [Bacillus thuringiensis serovar pingluonsis]|uniref:Flavodoxin n=1 Tax=Bacillus thuringiensis serovar pingluonsis TaxID=180881 RepID=A0A243B2M0_BACTU|nr:flavodoxin [Bacillus thuringiensis serovar pingluonsis]
MKNSKTLIVYYSRTGNTKAVAELIQEKVGGDLVQIETKESRPTDYRMEVEQNAQEQESATLPELKTIITNFENYDRIFIGAPTWNMALPQAVVSFLDSYNFEGKTVIPFNTNGGYGSGSTFRQINAGAKGAKVLEILLFNVDVVCPHFQIKKPANYSRVFFLITNCYCTFTCMYRK